MTEKGARTFLRPVEWNRSSRNVFNFDISTVSSLLLNIRQFFVNNLESAGGNERNFEQDMNEKSTSERCQVSKRFERQFIITWIFCVNISNFHLTNFTPVKQHDKRRKKNWWTTRKSKNRKKWGEKICVNFSIIRETTHGVVGQKQ